MHDLPPLKSLRVFEACIRLGNFTRAAKELRVGQPAISQQIQSLECALGVPLFTRRGARTIPTPEALIFYRSIATALAEVSKASTEIKRSKAGPDLAVATYPGIAMYWVMPRLAKLKQADPDLRIRVTTAERDEDIPLDDPGCAILFGDGTWPGYESVRLLQERVVPVAAPAVATRLARRSPAAFLQAGPLIHLEDQGRRWFTWTDWRNQRAPQAREIDPAIGIHQALMGRGITLGWIGVIDELIESQLLVALDPEPLSSERGYYLVAKAQFLNSPVGRIVLKTFASQS